MINKVADDFSGLKLQTIDEIVEPLETQPHRTLPEILVVLTRRSGVNRKVGKISEVATHRDGVGLDFEEQLASIARFEHDKLT